MKKRLSKYIETTRFLEAKYGVNNGFKINILINLLKLKEKSEFQGLSFIFIPIFRRCSLCSKLTSFVLLFSYHRCFFPLGLTQLVFSVKFGHMLCT
ncbi:hypothetical protein HanRHA438_Chr09g0397811 [Helianthus annuus]|nr:hypothetical protein HanRHA438_Chr09g0397811 [Helianthus annuus]